MIARRTPVVLLVALLWIAPAATAAPPGGVTAMALDNRVEVAWQAAAGATGYNVYRGTTPATVNTLVLPASPTPPGSPPPRTLVDVTAQNGTTYYYAVRTVKDGVESGGNSRLVKVTPRARSCTSPNAIVQENCFPGTTDWKVAQNPTGVAAFATAASISKGWGVNIKAKAAGASKLDIEIFRTGWYGGAGARLFSTIHDVSVVNQPACSSSSSTGLVDCAGWAVSHTITTTSSWPSGVYLLRVIRKDTGLGTHVLLVVRDDGRNAEVLYGVPDTTYQAYNNYGGKSLYNHNSTTSPTVSGQGRAVKVSFNRPYLQQEDNASHDWYTRTDQGTVAWLERLGYDISYTAVSDLERRGSDLLGHDVFVAGAHDEYWSAAMRTAVENARANGVDVFFTGANSMFWKVRFEPSVTGQLDRTLVSYKTTQSGPADPSGIHTGTWRDPAGANKPENAVLGGQFIGLKPYEYFPLKVSAAEGRDPVWRNTDLASLPPGGSKSIGTSLVGWEWDARTANGREPAGVKTLASSPVQGDILQNAGDVYAPGTATAHAVKYRHASGALVLTTGTNQWNWGLAVNGDGLGEPHLTIQQATTNILYDMGALPTTAPPDIVVAAATEPAPVVTSHSPAADAEDVPNDVVVRAMFDVDLDPSTVNSTTFKLTTAGGAPVAAAVSYEAASRAAVLTPTAELGDGTRYTATLTTGVRSASGKPLTAPVEWSFTTNECPCSLMKSLTPAQPALPVQDGRTGPGPFTYELGTRIEVTDQSKLVGLRFYKSPGETGTHTARVWSANGTQVASAVFESETASGWQQQALPAPVTLDPGQAYTVSVGVRDFYAKTEHGLSSALVNGPVRSVADGQNGVFDETAGRFPTDSWHQSNYFVDPVVVLPGRPPRTPAVSARTPAPGSTGVPTMTSVTATFSVPLDPSTANAKNFVLEDSVGEPVPASVSYDAASRTATLDPQGGLDGGRTYTARLTTGIRSDDETPLPAPVSWSFQTVAEGPRVVSVEPAAASEQISASTTVSARFSRAMNPATLGGAFSLSGPGGAVPASVSYEDSSRTATLTPASALQPSTTYTARVATSAKSADGAALAQEEAWTFRTSACPCRLFPDNQPQFTWTGLDTRNGRSGTGPWTLELGLRIRVSQPAQLTAVRFYKDPAETGGHTARVWTDAGAPLRTASFTSESASGWQQAALSQPLWLVPGETYVVSVGANAAFGMTHNGLANEVTSGPLRSVADGRNGVYGDEAGSFPTSSWGNSNYWVDAVVR